MPANRRVFMLSAAALTQALAPRGARGAPSPLDPADPQAKAMGYTPDASKPPTGFETRHIASAQCSNCAMFQGKAADAPGPCPLFGNKVVPGKGWCGSWVAKG